MGNLITLKRLPPETWVSMNNSITSPFISIFGLSGSALAKTRQEKLLVTWVLERNQSVYGNGCVGFDIGDLPWDINNFEKERQFIASVITGMKDKSGWERLAYMPDETRVSWLLTFTHQLEKLVLNMTAQDIDAEKVRQWREEYESDYPKDDNFPLCPIHKVLLTGHGCQLCTDE